MPLVNVLPECELTQLSRRSKKALQIICEQFHLVQIEIYELEMNYFRVENETGDAAMNGAEKKLQAGELKSSLHTKQHNKFFNLHSVVVIWARLGPKTSI